MLGLGLQLLWALRPFIADLFCAATLMYREGPLSGDNKGGDVQENEEQEHHEDDHQYVVGSAYGTHALCALATHLLHFIYLG
jgi:hypothetical protein